MSEIENPTPAEIFTAEIRRFDEHRAQLLGEAFIAAAKSDLFDAEELGYALSEAFYNPDHLQKLIDRAMRRLELERADEGMRETEREGPGKPAGR